ANQFSIGQTASDSGKQREILVKPIFVRVEGQLFFDTAHYPTATDPGGGRGKDGCHAATVWEIHPVTSITLVNADGTPQRSSDRFIPKRHRHPLSGPHSKQPPST